jgi:hypothetical protein
MAVQVSQDDIPKLMSAALLGAGLLFVIIVVLNHTQARVSGEAGVR